MRDHTSQAVHSILCMADGPTSPFHVRGGSCKAKSHSSACADWVGGPTAKCVTCFVLLLTEITSIPNFADLHRVSNIICTWDGGNLHNSEHSRMSYPCRKHPFPNNSQARYEGKLVYNKIRSSLCHPYSRL
jgi:hypothetical protein